MRWTPGNDSPDVIDRRGESGRGGGGGGLLFAFLPLLLRSKLGWLVLAVGIAVYFFRGAIGGAIGGGPDESVRAAGQTAPAGQTPDKGKQFVGFVTDDAQDTWQRIFAERGVSYERAKVVLYTDATATACGAGRAASGPFYCPGDRQVYLDLSFFDDLSRRFGAPGDFAEAYVIAHEIGHHVQNQLGGLKGPQGAAAMGATGESVRRELQADCFAGVWAHATKSRGVLETGDVEEGLRAAAAVGDDRLQKEASGRVHPESWTHGSSAQRSQWFNRGLERGTIESCDTSTITSL